MLDSSSALQLILYDLYGFIGLLKEDVYMQQPQSFIDSSKTQFDTNVSMVWKRPLVLGLKDSQATYWSLAFKLQWKIPPCSFTGLIPLFFSPCLCEWHNQRRKLIWILKSLISSRIFSLDFELKDLAPFTSFQIKYTPSFFIHRTKCSS